MKNLKFLTVSDVAGLLKLNCLTVYEYIRKGKLPAVKFGRNYRIDQEELEEFIISHKTIK